MDRFFLHYLSMMMMMITIILIITLTIIIIIITIIIIIITIIIIIKLLSTNGLDFSLKLLFNMLHLLISSSGAV